MTALYSHTTRAAGTVLTASIYNTDHQNHINNGVPAQLDDYSSSVAEMQTTTDPGEVGTESQATSMAGEFERLRFAILEIKRMLDGTVAQWYSTPFAGVDNSGRAPLPPWYIEGLDLQVAPSSPAFVEVATGWARNANDTLNLKVSTPLHRSVSSLWVSAATGGGMGATFTGTKQQAYVFVFKTQASGFDIGFDIALTASNLAARASASEFRRIGVVFAPTVLGGVQPVISRNGDHFYTGSTVLGGATFRRLNFPLVTTNALVSMPLIPTGFPVKAHVMVGYDAFPTSGAYLTVLDNRATANVVVQSNWLSWASAGTFSGYLPADVYTGPCGDIRTVAANWAGGALASGPNWRCVGFLDFRRGATG